MLDRLRRPAAGASVNGHRTERSGARRRVAGGRSAAREASDDRELTERAKRGDRKAFGQLYQRHLDAVYLYLRMRVRDPQLTEDLCQDVFLSAWRGMEGFRWTSGFRPWLLAVAHNRVANHWRRLDRRPQESELPEEDAAEPAQPPPPALIDEADLDRQLERGIDADRIAGALPALSDAQQEVLVLRFLLELSIDETATTMDRSSGAVKSLQHAAIRRLRQTMRAEGQGEESIR